MAESSSSVTRERPIRLFLVDDDNLFREGLRRLLEDETSLVVVGEADGAATALAAIPGATPDIIVLDVHMPSVDGIQLCRELRSRYPDTACLIVTGVEDEAAAYGALVAGASGYVPKQATSGDLIDALHVVASGESLFDAGTIAAVIEQLRRNRPAEPVLDGLSASDRRIVELIAEGMTNRQIADEIHLAYKTVKNRVSKLLSHLEMEHRGEIIAFMADCRQRRGYTA